MCNRTLRKEPSVEFAAGGGFEKIAWGDKNQFAMWRKMLNAFFNEEKVEVAATVKACERKFLFGFGIDVLKAHIRRIADNGLKLFGSGQVEEVHHKCVWWGFCGVEFNGEAVRNYA